MSVPWWLAAGSPLVIPLLLGVAWFLWFQPRYGRGFSATMRLDEGRLWLLDHLRGFDDDTGSGSGARPRLSIVDVTLEGAPRTMIFYGRRNEPMFDLGTQGDSRWFVTRGTGLHARDRMTGAISFDATGVLASQPGLALSAKRPILDVYRKDLGGARLLADDARLWRFDFATRALSPAAKIDDEEDGEAQLGASAQARNSGGKLADGTHVDFSGEGRIPLVVGRKTMPGDYLRPHFAFDGPNRVFVELAAPRSVIVVHSESLAPKSALLISRVSIEDGRALWTRSDRELGVRAPWGTGQSQLTGATTDGTRVLLLLNWTPTLVALDAADGRLLFRKRV